MKQEELQLKTNLVLASNLAQGFSPKRCSDWAIELMLNGYELEELDILAGLDCTESREIERYFEAAVSKLGLALEKEEEVLLDWYVREIAQRVVSGALSPQQGQEIVTEVYYRLDYPSGYGDIVYADDYWYVEECNGAKSDDYEAYLKNQFIEFLTNTNE